MVALATSSGAAMLIPLKQELDRPIAMASPVPLANKALYRRDHEEAPCKGKVHEKHPGNDYDYDDGDDDDEDDDDEVYHNGHDNHDNHESHDGHDGYHNHSHDEHGQGASSEQKGGDGHDGAPSDYKGVDSHDDYDHSEHDGQDHHVDDEGQVKPNPSSSTAPTPTLMPGSTGSPPVGSGASVVFGQAHIAVGFLSVVVDFLF
ncbi:hypothetical protein BG005_006292 [Podila minutissima]|nr:hypothetical protein BG005_006292 [Podila minutissima]